MQQGVLAQHRGLLLEEDQQEGRKRKDKGLKWAKAAVTLPSLTHLG